MNFFSSNSTYSITYAANNNETANLISQLCGNKTVEQVSRSNPVFGLNLSGTPKSISSVQRALLLSQEVIQLPRDEQIVSIESMPPIKYKKIFYYKDKFFTKRLLPGTFIPTQVPFDPNKNKATSSNKEEAVTNTTKNSTAQQSS